MDRQKPIQTSIYIPFDQYQDLNLIAAKEGEAMAVIIRAAFKAYIQKYHQEHT